ncbi:MULTISPECIES: cytidine deaminase [Terrabacteria group]|uniref:cytidine deaminase n=1 Tax=Bacillati TaxID=1783272 RepID=UPI00193A5321|nr:MULTISPECIES: cytidine deaminase [Terrabacteria group]MBW9212384.1 cytidine deaminase [Trueperella sp. zg.1013]QRG86040.1 cytidine deaminase [Bulleidia sp. zg-1006]
MTREELIQEAFSVLKNSYAPYSNYHVSSALECKDGRVFHGVNIENASFGATNCGERSAVFAAISEGYRKEDFVAIAIVCDGPRMAAPCGICRQVLSELLQLDTPIYLSNGKGDELDTNMRRLLPYHFDSEDVLR